jgi:hypothetical protein
MTVAPRCRRDVDEPVDRGCAASVRAYWSDEALAAGDAPAAARSWQESRDLFAAIGAPEPEALLDLHR